MPESNKLINNGYLRTPHIFGVSVGDSDAINMEDGATTTVISPLLGGGDTTTNTSIIATADGKLPTNLQNSISSNSNSSIPKVNNNTTTSGSNCNISSTTANNGPHVKLPTVVYLGTDSGGGGVGGSGVSGIGGIAGSSGRAGSVGGGANSNVTRTALQRNAPSPYQSTTTPMHPHSDWLLKEPALRRRLVVLAVAFTVLGAAIGALAIYFAGSYRCQPLATTADTNSGSAGSSTAIGSNAGAAESEQRAAINYADPTVHHRDVCLSEECVRTAASLLSAMDTTADPCTNFFQYACGTWNKKHIIPEDRSSISTFEVLSDQQQVILKGVLEEPLNDEDNQATIKAKMFYKSCMDLPQIRKIGEGRLKEVLNSLGGWPVIERNWQPPNMTIEKLMGYLRGSYSEPVLVDLYVGADDKNSSVNILQIDQLQLALPSRDYYLKASSENDLKAYHKYMTQTAILLGADPVTAAQELDDVVQFEIQLVNTTLPEADRHDTSAIYKKITLPELQRQVPQLNWTEFLQTSLGPDIKLLPNEELVSYAMPYLVEMGSILESADRRVVHNYMIWRLVMSIMAHMIDEYQRERIEFRKILLGIQSERMRWSQCVEWTNKKLGMAVGALFIRDNFNQDSKDTALEMIHTIREAFNELLAENHWMDDETRAVAKEKADTMNERIGYPEILTNPTELEKEYENLTIVADNFMENVLNILRWDSDKNLQLLRQPVDKEKWTTEPAVVNAFYNPNKNDIVFPAGILQPLFYSNNFPKSLNYGGIGVVIGHEITHGFDDKGRQFDKEGNLMQWWNNATIEAFRERTQCIIDQYSKYKIEEVDMYINGRMTQGENIADNGGLKQAFRAYKKWVKRHGPEQELPGLSLTHDQLFFLNYAQIWCGSMRPEDALTKIRSSVHSPGFIRVLVPLSNSKDFAEAYSCKVGSAMNPVQKCSVW